MNAGKVLVGMSGGVDSSVAALLLQRDGADVAGLFMRNWNDDGNGDCRAEDDRRDAVAVCGRLGIPIHFRDFSGEYRDGVFSHFLSEYAAGRTPTPDTPAPPGNGSCRKTVPKKAPGHEAGNTPGKPV